MPWSIFLHRLCPPRFFSKNVPDEFQKRWNDNKEEISKGKHTVDVDNIGFVAIKYHVACNYWETNWTIHWSIKQQMKLHFKAELEKKWNIFF